MTTDGLDPVIHAPARLQIVATLAALPDGGALSVTRLHLRKLEDAGYVRAEKTSSGAAALTAVALTDDGRAALGRYPTVLRHLAAAALAEHFAQGRPTPDELGARLDATFAATTHGEISHATRDLPDVTVLSVTSSRRETARREHRPGPAASQRTLPHHRGWTRGGQS